MRKSLYCMAIAALLVVMPLRAGVVTGGPGNGDVRKQLSSYFAGIEKNSPTVLGGLASSPDTMQAIQSRIATMSDAEAAKFKALMEQTPDWKVAPEALAAAFPPEMIEHMKRVSADYSAEVPAGREMREDVLSLVAVLKMLPEDKLKELGVDRTMVASLEATFTEMTPLQAAMLHRKAGAEAPWDAAGAAAMGVMPAAIQRGAAALAQHGPITPEDVNGLEEFRSELNGLLRRIDSLPEETKKTLKADALRNQVHQLGLATPDTIFMIRHSVPPEMLQSLDESVAFLERIANLSDEEKKELEQFRSELTSAFGEIATEGSSESPSIETILKGMKPQELVLLKDGMERFGNWQTALPAFYRTLASPELPARLRAIQGPDANPAAVASLEMFRQETIAWIDAEGQASGADAALIKRARTGLETAPLDRLEIMRMSLASLPAEVSSKGRLSLVLMDDINFNCSVDFPSPLPDLSLDFICNPIEDALEAIRDGILTTVNTVVNGVKSALETTISTVSTFLTNAINTVSDTVNSIISSIQTLANDIWAFIQTVPAKAWNAIKTALNLLLDIRIKDSVTLRDLVGRGAEHAMTSMKNLLGLSEGWWTAVSTFTLPLIPCPPTGFHTPFGDVGDGAAADNYGRYRLVIDGIIGMIPDTETSLAIKIPAQILYMAFDFLGLCLEQAAANADQAQAADRHSIVLTNFTSLQSYIGGQITGLSNQTASQSNSLTLLINSQSSNIQSTLLTQSTNIQALITNRNTSSRNLVTTRSTEIQNLLQQESDDTQRDLDAFKNLNLRHTIERVLQAGVAREVASFQLLEPLGHLGLVRDIVRQTIDAMLGAQQGVGQAEKYFQAAVSLMSSGREKDAFKEFGKAYRDATK